MPATPSHVGGSFAPELTDARLDAYREIAEKADPAVGDAMKSLIAMADAYRAGPVASPAKGQKKAAGAAHPSGMGTITPLPKEEVDRLWDAVPYDHEVDMYVKLFDGISAESDKPTRDAAFHLAWLARELFLDREPMFAPPKEQG